MDIEFINKNDAELGKNILNHFYKDKMIPAEKKNYVTSLKNSFGPYLGIQSSENKTHFILDAASQIATLGHGFNPSVFFGTSQFLESWTNDPSTPDFQLLRKSFLNFLNRKLNWDKAFLTFVNSGAEANETALGYCYKFRVNKNANKVLAFEGSFHGRMMVTLAATWNKSKREPFEWKNYLAEYVKYPELIDSNIHLPFPTNWKNTWNNSSLKDFKIPSDWNIDPVLQKEIDSLIQIRDSLLSKNIFAILIEPMQCEGGDCYSSDRFNTALLLMAKTFKVPVIYDEVQTGFHLGKEFFWHRQFNLRGLENEQLNPDYVVCAKKAQIGIVLSHHETENIFQGEEFSVASTVRGYAHAISLDQLQNKILDIEKSTKPLLTNLLSKYKDFIYRPRQNGLAFAFDLKNAQLLNKFVDIRFNYGLLYYPAGNQTLRFRLNTSFSNKDLSILFAQLDLICQEIFLNQPSENSQVFKVESTTALELYEWSERLIRSKINLLATSHTESNDDYAQLESFFKNHHALTLISINSANYQKHRSQIIDIQKIVYEPSRQTAIEKFDITVSDKNSISLGLIDSKNNLVAIAFAGSLQLYPLERGVRQDPHFNDEKSLYMLDLTVLPEYQKNSLGKNLKYAISLIAISKGIKRIQGRNRDRLAGPMININLSLGAFEQNYIKEDYPDFEAYRDVFYYTTKVAWNKPNIQLSSAINTPISLNSITIDYVQKQLPFMINKICLSNFVSEEFLNGIKEVIQQLPHDLRHAYTCSGQSEAVDKVVKTIWVNSESTIKDANINKLLTFKGHFFGNGSSLSRSLSYDIDQYFEVKKLSNPTEENYTEIIEQVTRELNSGKYLAVFIEPLLQKSMEKVPFEFLKKIRTITKELKIPLVFNESASQFFRYDQNHFFTSSVPELMPDAGLVFMSGQSALTFTNEKYFLDQPLMLISTWDGDEFSFNTYYHAFKNVISNSVDYLETKKQFHLKLSDELAKHKIDFVKMDSGVGYFKGLIPDPLRKMFIQNGEYFIVCPSYDSMKEYLCL